jgi:hypothetical protein
MIGAQKIGDLSIKLANASLIARECGDDVQALFLAIKAAECLQLAKALGWSPSALPASDVEERRDNKKAPRGGCRRGKSQGGNAPGGASDGG